MKRQHRNSKFHNITGKAIALVGAFVLASSSLAGCGMTDRKIVFTTGFSDDEVFRIEDSVCSLQEAMVYLVNTQVGYENTFGSEIWKSETDSGTVEDRLKESVLAKLAQIKAMNLLAKENEITLDEAEENKAIAAAQEYYSSLTDSDIAAMKGVTEDDILQIMREQAIADKLYDYIIRDINPEISDDEARTITVEQLVIKTYEVDASGERIPLSETQKKTAYLRAKEAAAVLRSGESSFEEVSATYNESDESVLSFGKGEMEEVYEVAAFNLGTEEVSDIIETSEGYVIIKCISTFNREETEANKVKIVAKRKREVFGQQYDAFVGTLTKELNEPLWNSVELVSDANVRSSDFIEVYKKHFD
ncbi:peptidylprolyl isomerase [Butyrivibrio sp. MC2021]|uniref:peptidylprolyl isomerase n=1 Tax=Butyrivibrio sp. MC2021 TaxID=1408306 RepID=UPI00047CB61F|nr:peptidylprolyl isomerase [Butyrivibrio sp. MC2021]